jgi:hypothetical protein
MGVDPRLMHALVWYESTGDPWSFSVAGEVDRRTYRTLRDVVTAVATLPQGTIRVGLAGVPIDSLTLSPTLFMPCANLVTASQELGRDIDRCTSASKVDAISCAIAAYHGSWERPDERFAMVVRASASTNNIPNFQIPEDALSKETRAAGAHLQIINRWQAPSASSGKAGQVDSSPASNRSDNRARTDIQTDRTDARTIMVELNESSPAMFMQSKVSGRQQLFATSKH